MAPRERPSSSINSLEEGRRSAASRALTLQMFLRAILSRPDPT